MIIKTATFRHVARIWPRVGWGFDLRGPKEASPKTKQKILAFGNLFFFIESHIQ